MILVDMAKVGSQLLTKLGSLDVCRKTLKQYVKSLGSRKLLFWVGALAVRVFHLTDLRNLMGMAISQLRFLPIF